MPSQRWSVLFLLKKSVIIFNIILDISIWHHHYSSCVLYNQLCLIIIFYWKFYIFNGFIRLLYLSIYYNQLNPPLNGNEDVNTNMHDYKFRLQHHTVYHIRLVFMNFKIWRNSSHRKKVTDTPTINWYRFKSAQTTIFLMMRSGNHALIFREKKYLCKD